MADLLKTQAMSSDPNKTQMGAPPSADPNRTLLGAAPTLNATQTIKPVQCPVCKTFNPAGVMFCVECGLIFDRALPDDAFGAPAVQLPVLLDSAGKEHVLRPGVTTLGREGDVYIPDTRVSRKHAQVVSEAGVLYVEDLGSTNGTSHNGSRLVPNQRVELRAGDKISLGGYELSVSMPGAATATLMAASGKTIGMEAAPRVAPPVATLLCGEREFPLKAGQNSLGRKSENAIAIPETFVSGRHAMIEVEDDAIFLTDVGSTNGTLLNDAKLQPNQRARLEPSDTIKIGPLSMTIRRNEQ